MPNLTLKNEKDEDIQIADIANEKGVVIFLVPKADTREFVSLPFSLRSVVERPFSALSRLHNSSLWFS